MGIDGFSQNDSPQKRIFVAGLDTSLHFFEFKLKGNSPSYFSRKLKLKAKGNYQYVIVKNFKGRPQLRYRAYSEAIPSGFVKQALNVETPWESPIPKKDSTISDTLLLASSQVPESPSVDTSSFLVAAPPTKPDSLNPLDSVSNVSIPKDSLAVLEMKDSTNVKAPIDTIIPEPKIDPFEVLISDMKGAEFEFNRLNLAKNYLISNAITVAQTKAVFSQFKYDNTRIQYLNFAIERLVDIENLKQLESALDYELSKEQFRTKYLK